MEERLFVLEPLAAIAPELVLVRTGRTVAERVRELRAGAPR
jgi:7,8-dihydro-6-hydroxymethylpterin-pyrophosphokinase